MFGNKGGCLCLAFSCLRGVNFAEEIPSRYARRKEVLRKNGRFLKGEKRDRQASFIPSVSGHPLQVVLMPDS